MNENSAFPILWDIVIVETERYRGSPISESFLRLSICAYSEDNNFSTIAYTKNKKIGYARDENKSENWTVMKTKIDFPNVLEISEIHREII